ncbi:MAG: hypothetical protein RH981_15285, partial [Arenibacter sp.]
AQGKFPEKRENNLILFHSTAKQCSVKIEAPRVRPARAGRQGRSGIPEAKQGIQHSTRTDKRRERTK